MITDTVDISHRTRFDIAECATLSPLTVQKYHGHFCGLLAHYSPEQFAFFSSIKPQTEESSPAFEWFAHKIEQHATGCRTGIPLFQRFSILAEHMLAQVCRTTNDLYFRSDPVVSEWTLDPIVQTSQLNQCPDWISTRPTISARRPFGPRCCMTCNLQRSRVVNADRAFGGLSASLSEQLLRGERVYVLHVPAIPIRCR